MTMNSEKRIEAAKRLREKHSERNSAGWLEAQDMNMQALNYLHDLAGCLPDGDSAFTVLAELIDPTCRIVCVDDSYNTPETGRVDDWHYECSRCCYELDDGEMYEFESGALPFLYCPDCGARVVRDHE